MINVAALVHSMNVGPLTVQRANAPSQNANGGFVPAATSPVTVNPVAVHTAPMRELLRMPEADRNIETIQLYTLVRLYAAERDTGRTADLVEYQGRSYRVIRVDDYSANGGAWMAYAQLVEAP